MKYSGCQHTDEFNTPIQKENDVKGEYSIDIPHTLMQKTVVITNQLKLKLKLPNRDRN